MITIEDCSAFCAADPALVHEIARHEHLVMIMAFACAHCRATGPATFSRPMVPAALTVGVQPRPGGMLPTAALKRLRPAA